MDRLAAITRPDLLDQTPVAIGWTEDEIRLEGVKKIIPQPLITGWQHGDRVSRPQCCEIGDDRMHGGFCSNRHKPLLSLSQPICEASRLLVEFRVGKDPSAAEKKRRAIFSASDYGNNVGQGHDYVSIMRLETQAPIFLEYF
ncbi:hypothetical protein EV128_107198 [Rhizobium azibense]|nr:hypothetical protein EV128_107198 [Rhizobium azibense]